MQKEEKAASAVFDVTVLVVNHNYERYIDHTIESLLHQDYRREKYEIFVIDDASTDGSVSRLQKYGDQIRLRPLKENRGAVAASNIGFREARGDWTVKVDSDDWCDPHFISGLVEAVREVPHADFSYCDYVEVDEENGETRRVSLAGHPLHSIACGVLYRGELLRALGGYDESLFLPEYDLLIKAMQKGEGVHVPEWLYFYRRHPGSMTTQAERVREAIDQLESRHGRVEGLRDISGKWGIKIHNA